MIRIHGRICCIATVLLGITVSGNAFALQPLRSFVEQSKSNNPDVNEARAIQQQRLAQRDAAAGASLPSLTIQGIYTRNQYESRFALPGGPTVTITPQNGLDAFFTLTVPLLNIGAWEQHHAATANEQTAAALLVSTEVSVELAITQAYYQLLGSEVVFSTATESVKVAEANLVFVRDRRANGIASELDLQRALVDLARTQRDLAQADQSVIVARRSLESLSRLTPEPVTHEDYREDDLHEEAPLQTWLVGSSDELVAVKPAVLAVKFAETSRAATRAAWFPTVAAQGQERVTNAGGFTGRHAYYTVMATATWRFDFGLAPNVAAQTAAVAAAAARANKARRTAEDLIYKAWHQVRISIAKARVARVQVKAAMLAQNLARDRYAEGVATQLEVIQAQRDYFSAAVGQAQTDFDLQYARALLRLTSRRVARVGLNED
jgi:outer membrane protein TolC